MRMPWQPREVKITNLANNAPRGVSGIPPTDTYGDPIDAPIGEQMSEPSGFLGRFKRSLKGSTSIAAAREAADSAMALVAPWLANVYWTISRAYYALSRQAFGGNAIVYSCLRLLAEAVAEPPIIPYRINGDKKEELPFDHPLYKLLRNPNELMTTHEFVNLSVIHMGLVGRCHWWKERDRLGRIIALWPLRPDRVGPLYAVQEVDAYGYSNYNAYPQTTGLGSSQPLVQTNRILAGWNYYPPGMTRPTRIPLADVLSVILPDPAGESGGVVEGLGPMQVLAREIESDNEATSFVAALLKNSAMPGAVITVKTNIIREKAAAFKREFKRMFSGDKRGDVAVFDGDTAFQTVGFNMQQLEFPSLRRVSESRIAAATGIPKELVGFETGSGASSSRSTLAEFREYFAETTCPGWWRRMQEAITRDLCSEKYFGGNLIAEFDISKVKALVLQSNRQIQPYQLAFQAGAITVDEYRLNVLGLDPLPNGRGNVLYIPTLVTPVAIDGSASDLAAGMLISPDQLAIGDQDYVPDDSQANQVKPSQEHDNDPRAEPGRSVRPKRGKPSASFSTEAGTGGKIVDIEVVRQHLGQRGKAWIPPIEWRAPQYIYSDADPEEQPVVKNVA